MSFVCGVDLGGKRARLCFVDPSDTRHPLMVRFEPTKEQYKSTTPTECARWAANSVPPVWQKMMPLVVWFEAPFGPGRTVAQLSVFAGALLGGLDRTAGVEFVSAVECRKLVGLPARLAKSEIIEWARVESDADFQYDEHDADAYVVARAILAHGAKEVAA